MPATIPGPYLPDSYQYPIPDLITVEPPGFLSDSVLGGELRSVSALAAVHVAAQSSPEETFVPVSAQVAVLSAAQLPPVEAMACVADSSPSPAAVADASTSMWGVHIWWLIDRGANVSISNLAGAMRYADTSVAVNVPIGGQGKGQSTLSTRAFAMSPLMSNGKVMRLDSVLESLETRTPILNENYLWAELRAHVHTPTSELVFEDTAERVPLHKASDGRLWIKLMHVVTNAAVLATRPEVCVPSRPKYELQTAAVCLAAFSRCVDRSARGESGPLLTPGQVDDLELASAHAAYAKSPPRKIVSGSPVIAAMRLGASARGYEAIRRVCDGVGGRLSAADADAVDTDKFRASSILRRKSAPKISIPRSITVGCTCVFDGWGPHSSASPHGGHTYSLHCVVKPSKYGFAKGTILHRQPQWRAFVIACVVRLRALGVVVAILRFDRAGEFSAEFAAELERTLFVIVQMAPSKWHEGVGDAEVNNDILTRMGEAMVRRAGIGPAYMILARIFAQFLLNLRPLRNSSVSRIEELTGVRPSVVDMPLVTFGATVLALREKGDRGPHGSLDNGRTYEARMVGVSENSYMVHKLDTNKILFPPAVKSLNEAELVNAGLPPSAAQQSTSTQTLTSGGSPLFGRSLVTRVPPLPVPQPAMAPAVPTGYGMVIYQAMQGSHSLPDNLSARIIARFPDAVLAAQLDVVNDRHGQDVTARAVRMASYDRLGKGDIKTAVFSMPSSTFRMPSCLPTPTVPFRSQLPGQAMGSRSLPSAAKQTLMTANVVANYVCTGIEACDKNGIPWMVDCSPDLSRQRCVNGAMVDNAAWSSEHEGLGTFWHLPRMQKLEAAAGAKRYLIAVCALPASATRHKYIELMVSRALVPAADRLLPQLTCNHSAHVSTGASDGEPLPKELHDIYAQIATEHLLPPGVAMPPTPLFSGVDRPLVHRPAPIAMEASLGRAEREVSLLDSTGIGALDDAYVAGDLDASELYDEVLDMYSAYLGQPDSPVADAASSCLAHGCDIADPGVLDNVLLAMAASSPDNPIRRDANGDLVRPLWLSQPGEVFRLPNPCWEPSAMKAAQGVVDVVTDIGIQVRKVPATLKQLLAAPDCEEWLMSDQRAHQSVLAAGNVLVRIDTVPDGVPIAPCVTQRKYKIEQSTGRLESKNGGVKSRHCVNGARLAAFREKMGLPPAATGQSNIVDDLVLKMFLADAAGRRRWLTKADIGNAYAKGTRSRDPGYMYMAKSIEEKDADGTLMVYMLYTPLWGETEAGFEWDVELDRVLTSMGWKQCEGIPAMYWYEKGDSDARVVKIVDDLLFSESGDDTPITTATIRHFEKVYKGDVTHEYEPESFAGFKIQRSKDRSLLTLSQPQKVLEAVKTHMPELLEGVVPPRLLRGKALTDALDELRLPPPSGEKTAKGSPKLSKAGKRFQQIVGSGKFFERGVLICVSRMMHSLSCVMSDPPEAGSEYGDGLLCAESVLYRAFRHRFDGITYGRRPSGPQRDMVDGRLQMSIEDGAPNEFEVSADSSHGDRCVYGVLATYLGGSVLHLAKKSGSPGCTMEGEQIATVKGSEVCVYGNTVQVALGVPSSSPPRLITDNLSNQRVATNSGSATRSRHFLIRYRCLQARQEGGECSVEFTPDASMPADFLTKWINAVKFRASLLYARGSRVMSGVF